MAEGHGEGQADLAFIGVVHIHQGRGEYAGIEAGGGDVWSQVQPFAVEGIGGDPAYGTNDIWTSTGGDFCSKSIPGRNIRDDFE